MQNLVTIFGGSGFVGTQAVRYLAKAGWRIRVAVRNPNLAYKMRLLGDVGQIDVVQANLRDVPSLERALEGAAVALNLVGLLYETGRQGFQAVHVMGAKNVAETDRLVVNLFAALDAGLRDADLLLGFSQSTAHLYMLGSQITGGVDYF